MSRRVTRNLRQTGGREAQHLAFVNEAGIAQIRVSMRDAGPGRAAMQLHLRDGPERIAVTDRVFRGSWRRSGRSRYNDLRTYLKHIRVAKTGIESEQFLPAASVAEA